jgi:glycosyltransferase involved in cell wall biosynthesis
MIAENVVTILPFYNRRHTVLDTLASVAAQTMLPGRLLVIDDGSADGGAEVVRQWIEEHRARFDCRLVVQANRGVSAARNHALALAGDCDYVAFLDSDDLWPRDFLVRMLRALSADPRAVAATCDKRIACFDGESDRFIDASQLPARPSLWMLEQGADIASATLFRAAAIRRRGGFNPGLRTGEDSALFMPVSLDGPWLHVPGEPVTYRRGLAAALGDEENLTAKFRDNRRVWARIYEDFFVRGGGHAMLADRKCRRLLALAWFQAGHELLAHDAPREALACFRKATAWNPWRSRYSGWTIRTWLTAVRRSTGPRPRVAAYQAPAAARS